MTYRERVSPDGRTGLQRRVESWAAYTTALSRAIEAERSLAWDGLDRDAREADREALAEARKRVDALLWTTPEGYVLQNEHRVASQQAS